MAQYPPPQYPQYQQYPPGYPSPTPSTSGAAVVSLIFSILGLIGFLPLIGGIVGVIAGNSAKSDIRNRPGQVTGEGLAQAGVILGWLGLGLWGLGICLAVLIFGGSFGLGFCALLSEGGKTSMLPVLPVAGLALAPIVLKLKR